MKGIVRWTTGEAIEGETDNGKVTQFHSDTAASPMQIVLQAHGACSLIDVIDGLKSIRFLAHFLKPRVLLICSGYCRYTCGYLLTGFCLLKYSI